MKNIHILPTDKPSRLIGSRPNLSLKNIPISSFEAFKTYNIYITSEEEIKEGDWVIHTRLGSITKVVERVRFTYKKIILTTDTYLINDGVQAVDDEFLEWFVKNPSCEFVHLGFTSIIGDSETKRTYKMIILKENPKQIKCYDKFNQILKEGDYVDVQKDGTHKIYNKEDGQLYFKLYGEEDKVSNYFSNDMVKCDKDGNWITNDRYEDMDEPKQETLEEAAERLYPTTINSFTDSGFDMSETERLIFINGAKWQQEQEQNNENSWFNEYQKVEDYIIKRIGDKFLEATPEKYNTASEATIALLENNWQQEQNKKLYSEDEVLRIITECKSYLSFGDEFDEIEWFEQFKKK